MLHRMNAAMEVAIMGVTHEPETYARHHQGLVVWLERVLWITGFSMNSVKLSTRVTRSSPHYCCSTVKLVVMPDPAVPNFPGEIIFSSGILLTTVIQSAARKMVKRIITRYWDAVFKETHFRLIPRAILAAKDRMATHLAMAMAPHQGREGDHLLHTIGAYLLSIDSLLSDREKECCLMHAGIASSAQCVQMLENEVQRWTLSYARVTATAHRVSEAKDALELKLQEETALRVAAENKLIQAEARTAELEARQAKEEEAGRSKD
jgi:hypothetical protein